MIDLYYWPTPNGHKITICLEETGLRYQLKPVDIGNREQFQLDFLKISPNNKIPVLIDHQPEDGGKPISLFESGAILLYLAEKTKSFFPEDFRERYDALPWLFWQMASLGPMLGQNHHFSNYAPEKIPYAIERYHNEAKRLYDVLNKRLQDREYIAINYSIVDMACFPWVVTHERQNIDLDEYLHVKRWFTDIKNRPAVLRAYARADEIITV